MKGVCTENVHTPFLDVIYITKCRQINFVCVG